jgi:hypothetical protein
MAYIGIGYSGKIPDFLHCMVEKHSKWLKGDRSPHFYGDCFLVLYDSNTAREFAHKCEMDAGSIDITVYPMSRPIGKQ